jgi:hypothetical protein
MGKIPELGNARRIPKPIDKETVEIFLKKT